MRVLFGPLFGDPCSKNDRSLDAGRSIWLKVSFRLTPVDASAIWASLRGPLLVPKCVVFCWFYNKNENLCYHGTGSEEHAREAARWQHKGMSMPEHDHV